MHRLLVQNGNPVVTFAAFDSLNHIGMQIDTEIKP